MEKNAPCPFGKILIAAREARGIKQAELARRCQRDPRYISQLELGKREPLISTVVMLARALEMDVGELARAMDEVLPLENEIM